jgi:hypothetical protein
VSHGDEHTYQTDNWMPLRFAMGLQLFFDGDLDQCVLVQRGSGSGISNGLARYESLGIATEAFGGDQFDGSTAKYSIAE